MLRILRTPDLRLFVLVSCDAPEKLHPEVLRFVQESCTFYKRDYNVFNNKVKVKRSTLAYFSSDSSVLIPCGFLPGLVDHLTSAGVNFVLEDKYPRLRSDLDAAKSKFSFRAHQEECLTAIVNSVNSIAGGGLVVAPPAFGKTFLIASTCVAFPDAKIHVVSRRRDVVMSIFDFLQRNLASVGIVTSGKHLRDRRIIVYTIDSLFGEAMDADLVILDEIHELVTDRYFELLAEYGCPKIGLTATPDTRFDNLHKRITAIVGDPIYTVDFDEAVKSGLVVPIVVQWFDVPIAPGEIVYNGMRDRSRAVWSNEKRNERIASIARQFFNLNQQTLILVTTIEHAYSLHKHLPEFSLCYAGTSGEGYSSDYPPMTSKRRDELRRAFVSGQLRGVIATGVWSTGVSFTELQVLIRADAQASATYSIQAPGRVCRVPTKVSKPAGLVIDFMDKFSDKLHRAARARSKTYRQQGWIQLDTDGRVIECLK